MISNRKISQIASILFILTLLVGGGIVFFLEQNNYQIILFILGILWILTAIIVTINLLDFWEQLRKWIMIKKFNFETQKISSPKTDSNGQDKGSIVAVNSLTHKAQNQDSCDYAYIEKLNANILIIADGVGSHSYAKEGSNFVVKKAMGLLKERLLLPEFLDKIDFKSLFQEVQQGLDKYIVENFDTATLKKQECFGSTMIIGIDFPDRFVAAYVGNGSIFNISGYFATFPKSILLPWNAINLLNPHTIEQNGKEALYKIFSFQADHTDVIPSVIEIQKEGVEPGSIFVITTDGVFSADSILGGSDDEGNIWIPSSKRMEILYEKLKAYLTNKDLEHTNDSLKYLLKNFLEQVRTNGEMDDDTTLGIIITGDCLNYFKNKANQ